MKEWKEKLRQHKRTIMIIGAFTALGVAFYVSEQFGASGQTVVTRGEEGTGSRQQTYEYQVDGGEPQQFVLDVDALIRDSKAAEQLLEEAVAAWEESWLGDNPNSNEVRENLNLPTAMFEGLVEISYVSDFPKFLQTDGTICQDGLPEEGQLIELVATFSYGDLERYETRYLVILPPEEGSPAWIYWNLKNQIRQSDENSKTEAQFALPDQAGTHGITWKEVKDPTWMYLIILGIILGVGLELKEKEEEKTKIKLREKQLMYEYPQMVDQLSMLYGSGMTMRRAWERMLATDQKRGEKLVIEEMWITYREISSGMGEAECYERFGNRIGLEPYRKLGSLLAQNIQRGSRDLQMLLEQEAKDALAIRKNLARRLGEEASTKLLFPMLLMLGMLLLVLVVPVMMSF